MFNNTTLRATLYLLIVPLSLLTGCSTAEPDVSSSPTNSAAAHSEAEAQVQAPAPVAATLVPEVSDTQMSKQAMPIPSVYFETNSSSISPRAKSGLRIAADWLKKQPANVILRLEAHCDERGSDAYNLRLSERRAQAAKAYLVGLGIDTSRLKPISYGEHKTAAEIASQMDMKFDRRVTMIAETDTTR
jgi:peptidoglycan-associated lipoprotein